MAGTLLIIGITFFLVGTLVIAQDASDRGRSWLVVALPFTGFAYARHHWENVRVAVLLRVLGGLLIFFGIGVFIAQRPEMLTHSVFATTKRDGQSLKGSKDFSAGQIAASNAVLLTNAIERDGTELAGNLAGLPFNYTRVQLIQGVLSMQQGKSFIPDVEVRILVDLDAAQITKREDIFVRPSDAQAPEVQVSVLRDGDNLPQTKIYTSGYSMELQLAPIDKNQLKGFLQLVLPGEPASYLAGDFVAYTNNLRYRNGRVDLTHDDKDTLEYVAAQYVQSQYPAGMIATIEYTNTVMRLSRKSGSTIARVFLTNGRVEDKILQLERADIGWALRPGGVETKIVQKENNTNFVRAPTSEKPAVVEPPLVLPFAELGTLAEQRVVIKLKSGEVRDGKVIELRRNLLQIESQVGSGLVRFSITESEIASIKLASGRAISLSATPPADGAIDAKESPVTPAPAETNTTAMPAQEPESAPTQVAETKSPTAAAAEQGKPATSDSSYANLVGKNVIIVTKDGKSRAGVLQAVDEKQIKLGVRLGSGTLEYFYVPSDIESITASGAQ